MTFARAQFAIPGGPSGQTVFFDRRVPADVLEAYAFALTTKNFRLYKSLLRDTFEFFPRIQDVYDLPWMGGDSWDRTTELLMIGNMLGHFDQGPTDPVRTVHLDVILLSVDEIDPDFVEIRARLAGIFLTTPTDGWSIDTGHIFGLRRTGEVWGIEAMSELPSFGRDVREEGGSWGMLKALFR